jgi:hypothetical protein
MSLHRLASHARAAAARFLHLLCASLLFCAALPASAQGTLDSLAREVDRTESLRAVLDLQRSYAQYAQAGLWNQVGALFTADGSLRFDGLVKAEQASKGPAAIASFLRTRYGGGYEGMKADGLSTMMIDAPVANLSVDGNSAKVRWETWTFHGAGGAARVEGGVYQNEYVRQNGVWKIAQVHYFPEFDGPYETGWINWGGGKLPIVPRHYTVDMAGIPIPPAVGAAPKSNATLAALQARVDRLNDEDRVRNLQSAYGYYQDRKMWDDVVDLFADNGVVEVGNLGIWRGKAGVRRWLDTMGPAGLTHGQLHDRVQFDVIVEVAAGGNEAWARGIELGLLGEADQEKGWWEVAIFHNRFVKEAGVWKLRELRRFPQVKADVLQGWGKSRIVDAVPTGAARPDAPTAQAVKAGLALPAFLRVHPVTGKRVVAAGDARMVAGSALTGAIAAGKPAPANAAEVARRLARSAAFDGVANVSAAYGHYIDDEDPSGFIGVLATKGFKGGRTGYYVTRASNIRARVQRDPPTTREGISYHWLVQPVVLVSDDGRSANARLRLFQPRTGQTVGKAGDFLGAMVLMSTYHDGYVLEDGIWRIWDLTVDPQYIRPVAFKDGIWAKAKDPVPQPAAARPPVAAAAGASAATAAATPAAPARQRNDITAEDLGATRSNGQWPGIMPMWFSYTNPVSGRVPPLYQKDCVPCGVRPDLRYDANGYQQPPDAPAANRSP